MTRLNPSDRSFEILERCGTPWAAVFGNHDDEGTATRHELMDVMQESALSLSEPGPAHVPGVGNYILTVQSSEGVEPAALLYFIDFWELRANRYRRLRLD